jgi:hypothetical protein
MIETTLMLAMGETSQSWNADTDCGAVRYVTAQPKTEDDEDQPLLGTAIMQQDHALFLAHAHLHLIMRSAQYATSETKTCTQYVAHKAPATPGECLLQRPRHQESTTPKACTQHRTHVLML